MVRRRFRPLGLFPEVKVFMRIHLDGLRQTRWSGLLVRFLFGGLITVATGLIGSKFGPAVAGLFLAFPAIFPASATLCEKDERERKAQAGLNGEQRGRAAAAIEASATTLGAFGLVAFSVLVWELLPSHAAWWVLIVATLGWSLVAGALWWLRRRA
jgi:hypothetical protein